MIWLTGSDGMLGTEVVTLLAERSLPFTGTSLDVDITDAEAVESFASHLAAGDEPVDWIVNCAAYTAVDRAEDDTEAAFAVNAQGVCNLARAAQKLEASVLHISTDYVFRGNGTQPHLEDEPVDPVSVYGRSKARGEELLQTMTPRSVIVRTSWLYGLHGPNFVTTMLRLFGEREEVRVVDDQYGGPTWAADLAKAILQIVVAKPTYGVYHFANAGVTSWYGFAVWIERRAQELGLVSRPCAVVPVSTNDFPRPAPRPANSRLSTARITAHYGIIPRPWQAAVDAYLHDLVAKEHQRQ